MNKTAKGKKEDKNQAKFHMGISYGKGVVLCTPFTSAMNSEPYFNIIILKIVQEIEASSNPIIKKVPQDKNPVMNLKSVVEILSVNSVLRFKIPARSPDASKYIKVFLGIIKKKYSEMLFPDTSKRKHLNSSGTGP